MSDRPLLNPIMRAFVAMLESIDIGGGKFMPIGRGEAPDCPAPYLIVSSSTASNFVTAGGQSDGTMAHPEADGRIRIQVTAVGDTDEQATWALDKAKVLVTRDNLQTNMAVGAGRRVMQIFLDVSRGGLREERGLPDATFSSIDQYVIRTTPAPSL